MKPKLFVDFYNAIFKKFNLKKSVQSVFLGNFDSIFSFLSLSSEKFFLLDQSSKKISQTLLDIQLECIGIIYNVDPLELDFHNFVRNQDLAERTKNVIIYNFKNFDEFIDVSNQKLISIPSTGKKTLIELSSFKERLSNIKFRNITVEDNDENFIRLIKDLSPKPASFNNIYKDAIQKHLKNLDAVSKRLSGEYSLAEAGNNWTNNSTVSRERVRQIEASIIKKINNHKDLINEELEKAILNNRDILYLWQIEINNPFFKGIFSLIQKKRSPLLKHIICNDKSPIKLDDKYSSKLSFCNANSVPYKQLIEKLELNEVSNEDIEKYLILYQREDLIKSIQDIINDLTPNSVRGKSIKFVKEILHNATSPLSQGDINKLLITKYSLKTQSNQVHEAIKNIENVYRFSETGWGLEEKFRKLNDSELKIFGDYVISYLRENKNKQFSTKELLSYLINSNENIIKSKIKSLTNSDIDWVLQKNHFLHSELNNHGRKTWSWGDSIKKRTNKNQLAIKILDAAGKPLTNAEIMKEMSKSTSIDGAQLHQSRANPDLVMIERNLWGLRWRDLDLSEHDEKAIIESIKREFKKGNKILEKEDIKNILNLLGINSISAWQMGRVLLRYVGTNQERSGEHFKLSFNKKNDNFQVIDINE